LPLGDPSMPEPSADAGPLLRLDADEELWEPLLLSIEEGRVVPIIGRDLLTITAGAGETLLYTWLAERLARALKVDVDSLAGAPSLEAVATRHVSTGGDPRQIYIKLALLLRDVGALPVPAPLKQLAGIKPFKLFVSSTFDSLLARAINEVRFDGLDYTQVIAYAPREKVDIPADWEQSNQSFVFHLLGKVSSMEGSYVVSEEDALEFVHSLQGPGPLPNLTSALNESSLLVIGCGFPAWLVRFFIRAARRSRLLLAREKTDFIVDARAGGDADLVAFLRNFKTGTEIFALADPLRFVDELSSRWQSRVRQAPAPAAVEVPVMDPGAVFISYASEDRPAAEALREALDAAGMDVWFDRDRLFAGDAFESRIRRNIERCSLFIAVLSKSCVTPDRRFFRLEWDQAQRVAVTVPESAEFILPVAVDDLRHDHEFIPEKFRQLHWQTQQGSTVDPGFVDRVRQLYREHQSRTVIRL
jgi:hypothetical protein